MAKESLKTIVARWGKNKTEADKLKKVVDADGKQIKSIMTEKGLSESESDGYVAKLSVTKKEAFDEDGLLQFIKSTIWAEKGSMECPYIERVEVVNWDALEKAMYNGEITKKQMLEMDKYKKVTETQVLRIDYTKED